ncbi:MAG: DUF2752 domain-containing protein [Geothrix sp.]|nr:DUF2752 domain-containing protein [Geothrix sp.]
MKRVPWVALATLLTALGLRVAALLEPVSGLLPGCAFKRLTGVACATCGLTRCVMAIGRWDWREAFHWHPAAAGALALLPIVAAWDLRRAWRGDPYPELPDSRAARLSVWAILAAMWALQVARGI